MKQRRGHGTAALGNVLTKHMRRHAERGAKPYTKDLGTITAAGIKLDRYGIEIPAGGYYVDTSFTTERSVNEAGGAGDDSFAAHSHVIRRPLEPGDRVHVDILAVGEDEWTAIVVGRIDTTEEP